MLHNTISGVGVSTLVEKKSKDYGIVALHFVLHGCHFKFCAHSHVHSVVLLDSFPGGFDIFKCNLSSQN